MAQASSLRWQVGDVGDLPHSALFEVYLDTMDSPMTSKTTSDSSRRGFLAALSGTVMCGAAALPSLAQQTAQPISPTPAPRDWTGQEPIRYPDPDIIAVDNRFRKYIVGNTVIKRLHTGTQWAEGPAWNGVGRYLVWSDIPNNVQMRWLEEDGRVTVFRNPSG